MDNSNTGGAAFPSLEAGMTLRDYFAARAMQTLIQIVSRLNQPVDTIAETAYSFADAMIKMRNKPIGEKDVNTR